MNRARFIVWTLLMAATAVHAEPRPYWVFFADRGDMDTVRVLAAKAASPAEPKVHSRRAQALGPDRLFNETDLPVHAPYVDAVRRIAGDIRTVTRYFNGVSVMLDDTQEEQVARLPFVREIRPVATAVRREPQADMRYAVPGAQRTAALSYGPSFDQLDLVKVTDMQERGYLGKGISIAVLDAGFPNLEHTAFDSLTVSHVWDFIEGNADVSGNYHGTRVLSVLAAYWPGSMMGAAPSATYLLARTEIFEGEDLKIEEDYWVSAVEWADSLGVDIINSSLGYTTFIDGASYTYQDLDGRTAVTTLAANQAVANGIVVVTSAGNEGDDPWYYVSTPGDGFGVIAVGSVNRNRVVSSFSSRGPTYDGRVKPDFMAMGEQVVVVDTTSKDLFIMNQGTSYAAPMLAGAAALLLEVHPGWNPSDVYDAFRDTAVDLGIAGPDSLYGYGLADTFAASGLEEEPPPEINAFLSDPPYPQPLNFSRGDQAVYFPVELPEEGELAIDIYTISGDTVRTLRAVIAGGRYVDRGEAPSWDGTNFTGDNVAPGLYYYRITFGSHHQFGKIAVIR